MNNQTENYIILKPISERFNRVASEITDSDIKYIIKETIKEKIESVVELGLIAEIVEDVIGKHEDDIRELVYKSIVDRLKK